MKHSLLFLFLFLSMHSYSQVWVKHIDSTKAHHYTFEEERAAFQKFWVEEGQKLHELGHKIEGLKNYRRREIRHEKLGEYATIPKRTLQQRWIDFLSKAQHRRLISTCDTNTCIAENFEFIAPRIKRSYGFGVVRTIEFDSENNIWVGGLPGGLWKSSDMGNTWEDKNANIHNPYVLLISCHSANANEVVVVLSTDVLRSYDEGNTWHNVEINGEKAVRFRFFPDNEDRIIASTQNSATYISIDGGTNWQKAYTETVGDFLFHPVNSDTIYARGIYSGALVRSANGGTSWEQLNKPTNEKDYILAVTPANPNLIYLAAHRLNPAAIYKSHDRGDTWNLVNDSDISTARSYWTNAFAVSPKDENHLTFGTVKIYKSVNGGKRFFNQTFHTSIPNSTIHVDQQDFKYLPNSDTLLLANDGGIYWHDINSDTLTKEYNGKFYYDSVFIGPYHFNAENLGIMEVYGLDYHPTDKDILLAGAWHNGSSIIRKDTLFLAYHYGDGFYCWIDPQNPERYYTSSQNGSISRHDASGHTSIYPATSAAPFKTKFYLDKQEPNILYLVTGFLDGIYKSTDHGDNWTYIHQTTVLDFQIHRSQNQHLCYIHKDAVNFSSSDDGGSSWETFNFPGYPTLHHVKFDYNDPEVVYFANNMSGDSTERIHAKKGSLPGGENLTYNFPDIPIFGIESDSCGGLYAAVYGGVLYLPPDADQWIAIGKGLPYVDINLFVLDPIRNRLLLGTDGRGIWSLSLESAISGTKHTSSNEAFEMSVYPNPFSHLCHIDVELPISSFIHLALYDANGRLLHQFHHPHKNAGVHRFTIHANHLKYKGVYFVEVQTEKGIVTKKLVHD